jgi:hypothetical protein
MTMKIVYYFNSVYFLRGIFQFSNHLVAVLGPLPQFSQHFVPDVNDRPSLRPGRLNRPHPLIPGNVGHFAFACMAKNFIVRKDVNSHDRDRCLTSMANSASYPRLLISSSSNISNQSLFPIFKLDNPKRILPG